MPLRSLHLIILLHDQMLSESIKKPTSLKDAGFFYFYVFFRFVITVSKNMSSSRTLSLTVSPSAV